MDPEDRRHERLMTGLIAFFAVGFFIAIGFWPMSDREEPRGLPTAGFRRHHDELKRTLQEWTEMVDALHEASPGRQIEIMQSAVYFLKQHLLTHAAAEERVLYPAVDRLAPSGPRPFTASMRQEHRILERWVRELEGRAHEALPGPAAFCHRAHEVAGLLFAHFEVEEQVLLPILDRQMTPAQFEREVWSRMLPEIG